jgi:hypothetical protein
MAKTTVKKHMLRACPVAALRVAKELRGLGLNNRGASSMVVKHGNRS